MRIMLMLCDCWRFASSSVEIRLESVHNLLAFQRFYRVDASIRPLKLLRFHDAKYQTH